MDTYRYADLINAAGDGTTDSLIADLREGIALGIGDMDTCPCATPMCADCVAGIASEVLRELLNTERV